NASINAADLPQTYTLWAKRDLSQGARDQCLIALVGLVGALVAFKVARFILGLINYFTGWFD
ncbi:hypothetical protein LPJ73_004794, partial [Coemansia sp. RSA 2703]